MITELIEVDSHEFARIDRSIELAELRGGGITLDWREARGLIDSMKIMAGKIEPKKKAKTE